MKYTDRERIDQMVMRYIPEVKGLQSTVYRAMREAVEHGGKRIRPLLMYETYKVFAAKVDDEEIAPYMSALEMIHTSSLIHDDLPCMDNDTMRRGYPTTWVSFGEDMATLAGDALIVQAFETLAEAAKHSAYPKRAIEAISVMATKTGMIGMIGGQTVDVEKTGKKLNEDELDFIYRLKTGALLEAAMMVGAIIGGADDDQVKKMEKAAADLGLAFQIRDDILDEISTEEELGKPIHSDEDNNKTTYVSIYGLKAAQDKVKEISKEAEDILTMKDKDTDALLEICDMLINRTK